MTTFTKERLLTIKQWRETYGPGSNVVLPAEEAEELARIALASLEQNALSGNSRLIPGEVLSAIREVARIRADFDDFDGDRRGVGDCLDEAEQDLIVTINKYASQLAAEPIATNDVREQEIKGNIRQQLYGFYIAYDLWLSNGAKPGGVFSQNYGLCANLFDYLTLIGAPCEEALEQLHADFRSAGLNEALPFNESKEHYHEEIGHNMCHMNPARAAWVRAQIAHADVTNILIEELKEHQTA